VALRASYIYVGSRTGSATANAARGRIERRAFRGDFIEYVVSGPLGQLIVRRPPTEIIAQGDDVAIWFAPEHCMLLQKERRP
jgi:TOBE domain